MKIQFTKYLLSNSLPGAEASAQEQSTSKGNGHHFSSRKVLRELRRVAFVALVWASA